MSVYHRSAGADVEMHKLVPARPAQELDAPILLPDELHKAEPGASRGPEAADSDDDDPGRRSRGLCACRRVEGNHILVYGKPRGRKFPLHCLMGPDWCCSFVTIALITVPSLYLVLIAGPGLGPLMHLMSLTSFAVCLGSFLLTSFSDPGILKRQTREQLAQSLSENASRRNGLLCDRCNIYRPSHAQHCFDCDACIAGYDHHCPWTGKCIGKGNITPFYVFLCSLLFHLVFTIIVCNVYMVASNRSARRHGLGAGGT